MVFVRQKSVIVAGRIAIVTGREAIVKLAMPFAEQRAAIAASQVCFVKPLITFAKE